MAGYEPPFHMTNSIVDLLMAISEQLGRMETGGWGDCGILCCWGVGKNCFSGCP